MTPVAQARAIERLKRAKPRTFVTVSSEDGTHLGQLVPVSGDMARQEWLVASLCRWRGEAMTSFLTVFEPSVEKTSAYFSGTYLPDPQRILFVIEEADSRPIGIFGLSNITAASAELDLVIRGERTETPHLMKYSQIALIAWAFRTLELASIYLNVLRENDRARRAYDALGFRLTGETPLRRENTTDGYRLIPDRSQKDGPGLLRMELDRSDFDARNTWLAAGHLA